MDKIVFGDLPDRKQTVFKGGMRVQLDKRPGMWAIVRDGLNQNNAVVWCHRQRLRYPLYEFRAKDGKCFARKKKLIRGWP